MKKWLIAMSAFAVITAGASGVAWAAGENQPVVQQTRDLADYFAEDSLSHWAKADLADFNQADVLEGYKQDGIVSMNPQGKITRAEFVAILLRAADVPSKSEDTNFTDVRKTDWFYDEVATASSLKLVYGKTADRFAPNAKISRAEIAAILNRFFKDTIDVSEEIKAFTDIGGSWAKADIEKISQAGVVVGYGDKFLPGNDATRAEAASMIRRALHKETKAAPSEQELIALLTQWNDTNNALTQAKKFDELETFFKDNTTGFAQAIGLSSTDDLKLLDEQIKSAEATFEIKVTGTAAYKVKLATDRYAAVEVTGQTGEITVTDKDGKTTSKSQPFDETYLLRKANGVWKVYGGESEYQMFIDMIVNPAGESGAANTEQGTAPETQPKTPPAETPAATTETPSNTAETPAATTETPATTAETPSTTETPAENTTTATAPTTETGTSADPAAVADAGAAPAAE